MRYILLFLSVMTWFFFSGEVVKAASPVEYTAKGEEHFTSAHHPELLGSLRVPLGTTLVVEAGTTLLFDTKAPVLIDGVLKIQGTEKAPVIFQPVQENSYWNGIYSRDPDGEYVWFTMRGSQLPFNLIFGAKKLSHITLEDNLQNTLGIGIFGSTRTAADRLDNITFRNRLGGNRMGSVGILVNGRSTAVALSTITFSDTRAGIPGGFFGIYIEQVIGSLTVSGVTHQRQCQIHKEVSAGSTVQHYIFSEESCAERTIPIVFVPGYGTSINLSHLVKPEVSSTPFAGWRFFQGVTPAYSAFLRDVRQNAISFTIAYYDWRLPVEDAVTQYLIPAIEAAKKQSGSQVVHIVAHSFGGLLARSYVQSSQYQGDVVSVTEIGTPNEGSVKVYPVWEAGELPPDWQPLSALIRWYHTQLADWTVTDQELIHRYFPSAQQLLPVYPAITRSGKLLQSQDLFYRNTFSEELQAATTLLTQRTKVRTFSSQSELTPTQLLVGPAQTSTLWRDGWPLDSQPKPEQVGDGTVSQESAQVKGGDNYTITGGHAELPKYASLYVLASLYPSLHLLSAPPLNQMSRESKDMLWFFFDCPVDVTLTLPNGQVRKSTEPDQGTLLDPLASQVGEVAVVPEMIWMVMPFYSGAYTISVTAREDTPVKAWVNGGAVQEFTLKAHESRTWLQEGEKVSRAVTDSVPSPSPLPFISFPTPSSSVPPSFTQPSSLGSFFTLAQPLVEDRSYTSLSYLSLPFFTLATPSSAQPISQPKSKKSPSWDWLFLCILLPPILLICVRSGKSLQKQSLHDPHLPP
jgi:hypothetical protein